MEGNPKAPRFLVEPHIEPPRDAYVQHVRLITRIFLRILFLCYVAFSA